VAQFPGANLVGKVVFQKFYSQRAFDMNSLPEFIKNKILELPEYSYGVNRVTLELDDGSTYDEVYIGWGEEIIKVGNLKGVPFDPARVV
jgi:hypothetical protein